MNRKSLVILVLACMVAAGGFFIVSKLTAPTVGAFSYDPKTPFVVATETELATLDPIKNLDPHVVRVQAQIYEGLVGLDEDNKVVPKIAESWEPVDGFAKWRFNIRKGVKFHPSSIFGNAGTREADAEDVVFSFNRIMGEGSSLGWIVEGVIKRMPNPAGGEKPGPPSVKAVSGHVVEIELTAPDPFFADRLSSTPLVIMPREIASLPEGEFGVKTIIGTGPFLVKSRTDSEVTLVPNSGYWGERSGNLQELVFRVIKNDQIRLEEMRNGHVQFARVPSAIAKGIVKKQGDKMVPVGQWATAHANAVETFNVVALGFNSEVMDLPLRQAVNAGLRRSDLVQLVPPGLALPATGILPPSLPGAGVADAADPYNSELARKAFSESVSKVKSGPLEILVHEKDSSEELGQLVQAQLQEVGIPTKLTKLDYNTVIGRMVSGEFTMFIMAFEFTFPAAPPILEMNYNPGKIPVPNFWRYRNDKVTAALPGFQNTAEPAAIGDLVRTITKATVDDPPAAFLIHNKMLVVYPGNVADVPINGQSMPHFWKVKAD